MFRNNRSMYILLNFSNDAFFQLTAKKTPRYFKIQDMGRNFRTIKKTWAPDKSHTFPLLKHANCVTLQISWISGLLLTIHSSKCIIYIWKPWLRFMKFQQLHQINLSYHQHACWFAAVPNNLLLPQMVADKSTVVLT